MQMTTIYAEIEANTQHFRTVLESIPPDWLHHKPGENKWSPIEIAEHVLMLERGVQGIVAGGRTATDRDLKEQVPAIRDTYCNYAVPLITDSFLHPEGKWTNPQQLLAALEENRAALIAQGDWNGLCSAFSHARFGLLSKTEWIYLVLYHAGRHADQMQKIYPPL